MADLWVDVPSAWTDGATAWRPLAVAVSVAATAGTWTISTAASQATCAPEVLALGPGLTTSPASVLPVVSCPTTPGSLSFLVQPATCSTSAVAPTRVPVGAATAELAGQPGAGVAACQGAPSAATLRAILLPLENGEETAACWRFPSPCTAFWRFSSRCDGGQRFVSEGSDAARRASPLAFVARCASPFPHDTRFAAAIRPSAEDYPYAY